MHLIAPGFRKVAAARFLLHNVLHEVHSALDGACFRSGLRGPDEQGGQRHEQRRWDDASARYLRANFARSRSRFGERRRGSPEAQGHGRVLPCAARPWTIGATLSNMLRGGHNLFGQYCQHMRFRLRVHGWSKRPLLSLGGPRRPRRVFLRRMLHRLAMRIENAVPLPQLGYGQQPERL